MTNSVKRRGFQNLFRIFRLYFAEQSNFWSIKKNALTPLNGIIGENLAHFAADDVLRKLDRIFASPDSAGGPVERKSRARVLVLSASQ